MQSLLVMPILHRTKTYKIYTRGDSKMLWLDTKLPGKVRHQRSLKTDSLADAKAIALEVMQELSMTLPAEAKKPTFSQRTSMTLREVLDQWIHYGTKGLRIVEAHGKQREDKVSKPWALGTVKYSEAKRDAVLRILKEFADKPFDGPLLMDTLRDRTREMDSDLGRHKLCRVIKESAKFVLLQDIAIPGKGDGYNPQKKQRVLPRDLEEDFLACFPDDRASAGELSRRDVVILLLDTGIRLGEARGLNPRRDYNPTTKLLHIAGAKNASSDRKLSLKLRPRIASILERAHKAKVQALDPWTNIQRDMKLAAKKLKLEKGFSPHSCRHTCATRLVEDGVPISTVGHWLGHASLDLTRRTYDSSRVAHLPEEAIEV